MKKTTKKSQAKSKKKTTKRTAKKPSNKKKDECFHVNYHSDTGGVYSVRTTTTTIKR